MVVEFIDESYCTTKVDFRIEGIGYAYAHTLGCFRHQLHQSQRTHIRHGIGVEGTFLIGLRGKEMPVPIALSGVLAEQVVIVRYLSFGTIEDGAVGMTTRGIDTTRTIGHT